MRRAAAPHFAMRASRWMGREVSEVEARGALQALRNFKEAGLFLAWPSTPHTHAPEHGEDAMPH